MNDEKKPGRRSDLMIDAAALTGAALITWGCAQIYHPAGFIVGGLFILAGAWMSARQVS